MGPSFTPDRGIFAEINPDREAFFRPSSLARSNRASGGKAGRTCRDCDNSNPKHHSRLAMAEQLSKTLPFDRDCLQ